MLLEGRCRPNESLQFNALDEMVDALARALGTLPRLELEAVLPRDARLLAAAFPVLERALAHAPVRPVPTSPLEQRRRAFAAMRELITRLSDRRRLVVHLDDVQWSDADSAAMLEEILRGPDPPTLLLVASYRAERDTSDPVALPRSDGPHPAQHVILDLAPLGDEESQALAAMLGTGDRAPAIAKSAGGSPLLVQLLAQGGVGTTLAAVLARMPEPCARVLEVLAIASHALPAGIVAAAPGLARAAAPGALPRLCNERLAGRSSPNRQGFVIVHDRVRDAILARIGSSPARVHLRALLSGARRGRRGRHRDPRRALSRGRR